VSLSGLEDIHSSAYIEDKPENLPFLRRRAIKKTKRSAFSGFWTNMMGGKKHL